MSGILQKLAGSRAIVGTLLALPGVWPVVPLLMQQDPSVLADPPKYILHHLGFTASVVLAVVLALTPLRVIFPASPAARALQRHRRLIGVTAFVYASLHVVMHFVYEGGFGTFVTDWRKPFILVGIGAFAILLALALTSMNAAVRAMGARWWKRLHRLAYLAAGLVIYHQISAQKTFPEEVLWVFLPLAALEVWRVTVHLKKNPLLRPRTVDPRGSE